MRKLIIAKSNTNSRLYNAAKAYVDDPCSPTYSDLKDEVLDMEGFKSKPVRSSESITASEVVFDLCDALMDIAEGYVVSRPVSGNWDTETEHEMKAIAKAFNISEKSAKALMINELGFDPSEF